MSKQNPWLEEIVTALRDLGGKAYLDDIYRKIEEKGKLNLSTYKDWKSQIRKNIYLHSSDTEVFKGQQGDSFDIFYSVDGKGNGKWALRNKNGSENSKNKRNPNWNRDELILALDLYFKCNPNTISKNNKEVIKLSEILNKLPIHRDIPNKEKFRNPNGVYMKMANFLRFDKKYTSNGRKGLKRGSTLEEIVWEEFSEDKDRLSRIANTIKKAADKGVEINIQMDNEEERVFPEGKVLYKLHKYRERNSKVVREKKRLAKERNELCCEICKFDFYLRYGEIGEGFIECHHIIPVSEYVDKTDTSTEDLILVCSNCHRMLHRKRPWLSKDDLKLLLVNNNKNES